MVDPVIQPRTGKRRLFFGLWPDTAVRDQIAAAAAGCVFAGTQPRVVPAANFHLTLAFLGGMSPASVPDVLAAGRSVRFAGFEVVLQISGYWQRSQVAWLAPRDCPRPLATLVDDLANRLAGLGLVTDSSQYRPHVTLARDVEQTATAALTTPIHWSVRSFALLESIAGPDGPVYTVLEEFPAWD